MRVFAFWMVMCTSTAFAQFVSLAEKETAKNKLDDFFSQADDFSNSFAVAFRNHTAMLDESTGMASELSSSGLTIKSYRQKLKYFCYEYDAIFNPPLPWRSESLLVGGLERRRSYSTKTRDRPMPKAKAIELDPLTGFRAEVESMDYFSDLGQEIDPYGLVLAVNQSTKGRNSTLEKVLKTWITRLELKSEAESKGLLLSKWNGFGREENAVGRRDIIFDSRVGYLPTSLRVLLVEPSGKNVSCEVRTAWEKYKTDQWRQSKIVVSYYRGSSLFEESFEFAWAEPEELETFLAKQDLKAIVKDEYSDWYKLFSTFLNSQKDSKPE